jgi:lipopolysaccharide transport system permease protein
MERKFENIIIEAGRPQREYWRDIWRFRELFYFLSWRDILVRYKQTAIGIVWSLLRPFLSMLIFTVIFGRIAKLPSQGAPYPLMVFSAMLPWQLFASALSLGSESLMANAGMISKVFFPRMILPAVSVIISLVDFLLSFMILLGMMIWYSYAPTLHMLFIPLFLILACGASLGSSLWVSAIIVRYRDFRFVIPFLVQLGMYVSPVGFSSVVVPSKYRLLYALNPMVGVIDGFRWCILGGEHEVFWPGLLVSIGVALLLLSSGVVFFRRMEHSFADVI